MEQNPSNFTNTINPSEANSTEQLANNALSYTIVNSQERHCKQISDIIKLAHGFETTTLDETFPEPDQVLLQINKHPTGHFIAVSTIEGKEVVLGVAITMRSHYSPDYEPLPYMEMIGTIEIPKHNPEGEWLYGVECAVLPEYQGKGVASALYKARFDYVRQENIKGMYACGMLKGYENYRMDYTQEEYGQMIINGEVTDPTVSVQIKNGFEARSVVHSYEVDYPAGNAAMLIVWESPDYKEES